MFNCHKKCIKPRFLRYSLENYTRTHSKFWIFFLTYLKCRSVAGFCQPLFFLFVTCKSTQLCEHAHEMSRQFTQHVSYVVRHYFPLSPKTLTKLQLLLWCTFFALRLFFAHSLGIETIGREKKRREREKQRERRGRERKFPSIPIVFAFNIYIFMPWIKQYALCSTPSLSLSLFLSPTDSPSLTMLNVCIFDRLLLTMQMLSFSNLYIHIHSVTDDNV